MPSAIYRLESPHGYYSVSACYDIQVPGEESGKPSLNKTPPYGTIELLYLNVAK